MNFVGFCNGVSSLQVFARRNHGTQPNTHYSVLGLQKDCTSREIKDAFIKLSKKHHPDKNTSKTAHSDFVKIQEAYSILSKPDARRDYDLNLMMRAPPGSSTSSDGYTVYSTRPGFNSSHYTFYWEKHFTEKERAEFRRHRRGEGNLNYDNYYGVKGIRRLPNSVIFAACVAIAFIGGAMQMLVIRRSIAFMRSDLDRRSKENQAKFVELRAEAERNGNDAQIKLLEERVARQREEEEARRLLNKS